MTASSPHSTRRGFMASVAASAAMIVAPRAVKSIVPSVPRPPHMAEEFAPQPSPRLSPEDAALNRLLLISYQSVIVIANAVEKAHAECEWCEFCMDADTIGYNAKFWNSAIESETTVCDLDIGYRLTRIPARSSFDDADNDARLRRLLVTALACSVQAADKMWDEHEHCPGCFLCREVPGVAKTASMLMDLAINDLDYRSCCCVAELFGTSYAGPRASIKETNLPIAVLERIAIQAGRESRA
jgi:hypothetical protein